MFLNKCRLFAKKFTLRCKKSNLVSDIITAININKNPSNNLAVSVSLYIKIEKITPNTDSKLKIIAAEDVDVYFNPILCNTKQIPVANTPK